MKILFVLLLSFQSHASEVWIGSNVGTDDMIEMVTRPQAWQDVLDMTSVFTFYGHQLAEDNEAQCPLCDRNVMPNFQRADLFNKLAELRLRINVEVSSVKPWDCDATQNQEIVHRILRKLKEAGGYVDHFSIDEPFMAGQVWCKQSDDVTATATAKWMQATKRLWEEYFPDRPTNYILLEPYPRLSAQNIIAVVTKLIARGQKPDGLHLDINKFEIKGEKMSDAQVKRDITLIAKFAERQGIVLGNFFAVAPGKTNEEHRRETIDQAYKMNRWYGATEHLVFQSWDQEEQNGKPINKYPDNLPSSSNYSLTGMARQILRIIGK